MSLPDDRRSFLEALDQAATRYRWRCYAWCLMDNHYHLGIETPDANLSSGMRRLNGVYTPLFNRRYARVGHLLQGRFKAVLVDRDSYLLEDEGVARGYVTGAHTMKQIAQCYGIYYSTVSRILKRHAGKNA